MIPPTSIDGTDITGATIDGTDVQEITVDGDVVFSAGLNLPNVIYRWKMDEGTGATVNDSVGSLDGTITGATWVSDSDSVGGSHLDFDGSDDHIDLGSVTNEPQTTIAFWVNMDAFGANNNSDFIIFWSQNGGVDTGMMVLFDAQRLRVNIGSSQAILSSALSTNVWYHIGLSYFSNGTVESTIYDASTQIETTNSLTNVSNGTINNGTREFYLMEDTYGGSVNADGSLDDVIIADTGLSRSRIRQFRDESPRA